MVKSNPPKTVRPIPFHLVKVKSFFKYERVKYMKYAPKKGMTEKGQLVTLPDAAMVEPVS